MKLSENDVEKQICDFLKAKRWSVTRQQSGLFARPGGNGRIRIGTPGMCDWLAIRTVSTAGYTNGLCQVFEFEVKAPGKTPSLLQEAYIAARQFENREADWFDAYDGLSRKPFMHWYLERFE